MSTPVPAVSVCIPVFNGARYIAQAIESVLSQSLPDFELVILDNASTDSTLDVVARFNDSRIRLVTSDVNIGAGANWNRGLTESRSEIVKILCADDVLYSESLERQAGILLDPEHADVVLVCSRRQVIDDHGVKRMKRGLRGGGCIPGAEVVRRVARTGTNLIGETSSALFRKAAAIKAGSFNTDNPYVIDIDLWTRMLADGDLYAMPQVLSEYRVSATSWSVDAADRQAADFRTMTERLESDGRFGIRPRDVRIGAIRCSLNMQLRRLFYALYAHS